MKIEFDTIEYHEVLEFLIDLRIDELKEPRINIHRCEERRKLEENIYANCDKQLKCLEEYKSIKVY